MIKKSQFLILIILVNSFITFGYDLIVYYSSLNIQLWNYVDESLCLLNILFFYLFLRKRPLASEQNVRKNLKSFILLLAALYLVVFLLNFLIRPEFTRGSFPVEPATVSALIYSNLISLTAVFLLTPMLLIMRNLVFYKYKKLNNVIKIVALLASLAAIIISAGFRIPLDFSLNFPNVPSVVLIAGNAFFAIALLALLLLATRNTWITYLSRKEKISYFFISVVLIWFIYYFFDFAFSNAVTSHSLALGVFSYLSWMFLVFYSTLASLSLLIHLPTARVFERKMKEVSSLHNLSRLISTEFDFDKLIRSVPRISSEVLDSSFTWLEMYDENKEHLYSIASADGDQKKKALIKSPPLPRISHKILSTADVTVINDLSKEDKLLLKEIEQQRLSSIAGVPLVNSNGIVLGILYAGKTATFGFDPDDVNMLQAYSNQASIAMENVELLKKSLEKERMEKELQIARDVQMRLLPQKTPQTDYLDIDTLTITAFEVGGDYHDFYSGSDTGLGLVIGDVSGKGTSAAFYMAEAKGIIQSLARIFESPRDLLIETNKILYSSLEKKSFISLLAGRIDNQRQVFTFCRAGHCPVIHYSQKEERTQIIQPRGIALGLDSGKVFDKNLEEYHLPLGRGDILALYTDGLSEARNTQGEEFGEERLCSIIRNNAGLSVSALKEVVIDEILKFLNNQNLHDDLTLLLIKIGKEKAEA